ncbi:hypothetical protein Mpsy_0041 [Methanolobus psychrophilus R15]|nr:hypothetical protein Mpsy_0041 [Methanolobus psychrophilus R15]
MGETACSLSNSFLNFICTTLYIIQLLCVYHQYSDIYYLFLRSGEHIINTDTKGRHETIRLCRIYSLWKVMQTVWSQCNFIK